MNVGDKVLYVPDSCHAMKPDASGEFPWAIGVKNRDGSDRELTGNELMLRLRQAKRGGGGIGKDVAAIAPKKCWEATVTAVNPDGTVSVDVEGATIGVTLHCSNLPVDPTGKRPHTVHAPKAKAPTVDVGTAGSPRTPLMPPKSVPAETR